MIPDWLDYTRREVDIYIKGIEAGRKDMTTPEFWCVRDFYGLEQPNWRVRIVCRAFGVWASVWIERKAGEQMEPGAWQALQERLIYQCAAEVARQVSK